MVSSRLSDIVEGHFLVKVSMDMRSGLSIPKSSVIVIGHNLLVKSQLLREKIVHQAYGWPPVRAIYTVSFVSHHVRIGHLDSALASSICT